MAASYRIRMVDTVNDIVGEYKSITRHSMAGSTVINAELNRSSQHDVIVFYVLVSLFIAADPRQIEAATRVRAPVIEIHVGAWCDALADGNAATADRDQKQLAH